jgi:hypothetical protein
MILMPPARKKGTPKSAGLSLHKVASPEDTAAPTERATPVIPDAAERSSGLTTAIV